MSMKKKKKKNLRTSWEHSSETINIKKQLAFLRENKRKIQEDHEIYYNEKQNQFDKKQYYQSIPNLDIDGIDLFYKFHELLKKTHKNFIPYFISKDLYLYTWVDLQPDCTVKNIYSGEQKNSESLIIQDHKIIHKRYEEFQLFLEKVDRKEFRFLKQEKSFEWKVKLNTEHIVPQSWFSGLEPMKGDLHHLFICDPKCNIARSNFPYHDFTDYNPESPEEPIHNHCGLALTDKFEPEYGKGAVARSMMYFLLRYPKAIKKEFRTQIDIPLLGRWHQEFPVNLYEKHRNQAIFRIQGNRNPFIDFPEIFEKINFPVN